MNWRQISVDISFIDWEKPVQPLLEIGIKTPSKTSKSKNYHCNI